MSSHTPVQDMPGGSHTHPHLGDRGEGGLEGEAQSPPHPSACLLPPRPHPRTRSRQRWAGSQWGRHIGSYLPCSHTGHRRRAGGYGHTRPHLGQRGSVRLTKGPGPKHPHCHHHLPQHCSLDFGPWTLPRLLSSPKTTDSFPVSPLMVSPATRAKLGHHLLRVTPHLRVVPSPGVSQAREYHSQKEEGDHPHICRKGEKTYIRPSPPPPLLCPVLHHHAPSPCLSVPQPCLSPVPTANGGEAGLDSAPRTHLRTGPPALGSGSQQGRHSGRSQLCCHSGLARRAVALGHIHPHLPHTPSPGSQPGKHSGKSRAGSHRPLCHKGLGSACTRPHLPRGKGPRVTPSCPPRLCAPLCLLDLHQSLCLLVCLILHPHSSNSPSYIPLPFQSQASCPPPRTLVSINRLLSALFSVTLPLPPELTSPSSTPLPLHPQ